MANLLQTRTGTGSVQVFTRKYCFAPKVLNGIQPRPILYLGPGPGPIRVVFLSLCGISCVSKHFVLAQGSESTLFQTTWKFAAKEG